MDKIKAYKRDQKADTVRSYQGRLKLLGADPQNYPAQLTAASTRKDKQFRKDKSAMLWDLVRRLDLLCRGWDNANRERNGEKRRTIAGRMTTLFGVLELVRAIKLVRPDEETKVRKASKRLSLKNTPANLDEIVADKLSDRALPAGLVLLLSGCRPKEIETGVTVEILPDGRLAIAIRGAKFTKKTGHEWRVLTVSPARSALAKRLRDLARTAGGTLLIKRRRRRLGKDIQAAAEAAGFKGISPYSFRHLVASRLKFVILHSKTISPEAGKMTIAKMLGHISTRTQSAYGTSRQGRGGCLALVGVQASGNVRVAHRPYPNGPGGVVAVSRRLRARLGAKSQLPRDVVPHPSPFSFG
jgi:integrase